MVKSACQRRGRRFDPWLGTKVPQPAEQLSLRTTLLSPRSTTTEPAHLNERAHVLQTTEPTCSGAHAPQLERENSHAATKSLRTATKTRHSPPEK